MRWTCGNQYTSFTAVYPDCFGMAMACSETMTRMAGLNPSSSNIESNAAIWARVLYDKIPSFEERKALADKAIDAC